MPTNPLSKPVLAWGSVGKEFFLWRELMKNWCSDIGRLFLLVGLLSVVAMAAGPASPFKFRTESIPGAIETDIFGVNNSMVGVGAYVDSHGVRHGLLAVR